jgi:hypothetical protein
MSGADPEDGEQTRYRDVGDHQLLPRYGAEGASAHGQDPTVAADRGGSPRHREAGPANDRREPVGFPSEVVQQAEEDFPVRYRNYDPNVVFGLPAHPQATTILTLAILGLFILVTAPAAWIMGNKARREMRQFPGRYQETSSLTVGWVLGIIGTAELLLLAFALAVIIFGAIVVAFTQL